jgi:pimeloyl-ACP methyl ester carboxylesterase
MMKLCAVYLQQHLPAARLEVVPGADHLVNLSQPSAFDKALEGLLRRSNPE